MEKFPEVQTVSLCARVVCPDVPEIFPGGSFPSAVKEIFPSPNYVDSVPASWAFWAHNAKSASNAPRAHNALAGDFP